MHKADNELKETSDTLRWLAAAAADWFIIAAALTAVFWWPSWWVVIVAVLIIGNRQHALGILGHDGAHFAICSHRPTNNALARWLAFLPMGLDLEGYRRFHFAHHRDVGTPADPELTHYRVLPQWEMPLRPWRLLGQCLGDMVGGAVPHIVMALRLTKPAHCCVSVDARLVDCGGERIVDVRRRMARHHGPARLVYEPAHGSVDLHSIKDLDRARGNRLDASHPSLCRVVGRPMDFRAA